jgi:hypothetical protein
MGTNLKRVLSTDNLRARLAYIFDFFAEDSQLNVYAGELEVRPPGAPTTEPALWD